jgi:hypothetical protein
MDMSFGACWDCPISVQELALGFCLNVVITLVGAFLSSSPRERLRPLGFVVLSVALLWSALYFRAVAGWGIRLDNDFKQIVRPAITYGLMLVLWTSLAVVTVVVRKIRLSKPSEHAAR